MAEQTGLQIKIGSVHGQWESLGLELVINQLSAQNLMLNTPVLTVDQVHVEVATLSSLMNFELVTEQIHITGLELALTQDENSRFHLNGLSTKDLGQPSEVSIEELEHQLASWFQAQQIIQLSSTNIDVTLKNGRQYPVNFNELTLKRGSNLYQLSGLSKLPGKNRIDFVMEMDGILTDPKTRGRLFIDTHTLNLPELPIEAFWDEAKITSGTLSIQLWADWQEGGFTKAISAIDVEEFQLSIASEAQSMLNLYDGYLVWIKKETGWVLETQDTNIISDGRSWPRSSLQLAMHQNEDDQRYDLYSARLDLSIISDLLLTNPQLDESLRQQLLEMEVDGYVDDLLLTASLSDKTLRDLKAHGRLSEIQWQAYEEIPGFKNLTGQFELQEDSGQVFSSERGRARPSGLRQKVR